MPAPSSVRLPPNPKVEIEFTAGVWTDVTGDVYPDVIAPNTRFGRTSPFSPPQVAEFSVALDNITQKYTPQNTSSIYYPNIQRRKRIRYSYNPGVQRFRFLGYIKQWAPTLIDPAGSGAGFYPVMQITARCRLDHFSRVKMLAPIHQEITIDAPTYWWPLTDAAGATQAVEQSGNSGSSLGVTSTGTAVVFGDNGPGFGDGPGVKFAGAQYLNGSSLVIGHTTTVEFWFNISAIPGGTVAMVTLDGDVGVGLTGFLGPILIGLDTTPHVTVTYETGTITSSVVASLNAWHHVVVTRDSSTGAYVLYVDGANVGSATGTASAFGSWRRLIVGAGGGPFSGNIGEVAVYSNSVMSSGRVATHAAAGLGYYGDTTDQRIARYLGYAGLTASDWTLDAGQVTVNTYPQAGADVLTACGDMATSENGGAVFYIDPTGKARFVNRRYRDNRTPKLTLAAAGDLDPSIYQPSLDDNGLVTQVTANRASESGTQTAQTYTSGAADVFASDVTTYTISDLDALALAQYLVNAQSTAALQFPQISIYLDQADHDLYDAVGQLGIGDRIRVNFPAVAYPIPTVDFFLEGWTEQSDPASGGYRFTMDVSPADNPAPRWQWDVSTWDGGDVWAL